MATDQLPLQSLGFLEFIPPIAIACLPLVIIFFYWFYAACRSRLVPVHWPFVGMLPDVVAHFDNLHIYVSDILREAGFTFMFKGPWYLGMDYIITSNPANVHHVFTTNFPNYPKGEDFAEIFDVLGGGPLGADGESWRIQRKMVHGLIADHSYRSLVFTATRNKVEQGLVPLLGQVAASGEAVDLENVFSRVTFDITCFVVFGFDPASLSITFPIIPFATAIDEFWEAVVFRHAVPKSCWKLLRWLRLGPEKKMARASQVIDHFITEQILRKRLERNEGRSHHEGTGTADLLTYYMDQPLEEVKGFFESEDKFLRDTLLFLMIAGRDAFAIGLSWFFWLLCKNPDVEARILDELRGGRTHEKPMMVLVVTELSNMVYLHGAVCEALRLFPPVAFEHKGALKADVLPSGHRVDEGMKVLFSLYAMGRMEEIWGPDCLQFRPERWILEGGKLRHVPAYKFLSFNSGPRSCLGKDIGLTQLKIVAAAVVSSFEVELVEGHVVEPKNSVMIRMKNGMKVNVRKRRS